MSNPRVLIVILVYNGADYIGDCLSSLAKITYPKNNFEILVIDNASTDNSVEFIKRNFAEIKLIENEHNIGFAAGNNIGFKYAADNGFDYVYLLNQDTVVDPDFLAGVVEVVRSDKRIAAVQSKLLLYHDKGKINSIGNEIHYLGFGFAGGHQTADLELKSREITYPSGSACLFDVRKLREVGYFNPEFFMYHEDADLGWRIWLAGFTCMLAPKSVVYHKYEFSRSIKKYYFMERNRYLVVLQNYKLATLLLITPACLVMEAGLLLYSFVTGFWIQKFKAYGYFLNLKSWQKIFKARKFVQAHRKVSDREVVKRFVGRIDFQDIDNPILKYIANPIFNLYWQVVKIFIWW